MSVMLTFSPSGGWFRAESPDWPDLSCEGWSADVAVEEFIVLANEHRPLSDAVIATLHGIGGSTLVAAWDSKVVGSNSADLRLCPATARAMLKGYKEAGINPLDVPSWWAAHVSSVEAGIARQHGLTFYDYRGWLDRRQDLLNQIDPWSCRGSFLPPTDWIQAGVSIDNFITFAKHDVEPHVAADAWEPLISKFHIPSARLENYLKARITPHEAETYERRIVAGEDLETTIAVLAALAPPAVSSQRPPF